MLAGVVSCGRFCLEGSLRKKQATLPGVGHGVLRETRALLAKERQGGDAGRRPKLLARWPEEKISSWFTRLYEP